MSDPIFRTAGAWGAGKGANLTPAEVDGNFYALMQRLVAIETGTSELTVTNVTMVESQLSFSFSDGTTWSVTVPTQTTYLAKPIAEQATGRTLALTDTNTYIRFTNATPATVIVPADTEVSFPVKTEVEIRRGSGALSLGASASVTLNYPTGFTGSIANAGDVVILKKVAADTWDVILGGGGSGGGGAATFNGVRATVAEHTFSTTDSVVNFTLEDFDSGWHDNTVNPNRLTAPASAALKKVVLMAGLMVNVGSTSGIGWASIKQGASYVVAQQTVHMEAGQKACLTLVSGPLIVDTGTWFEVNFRCTQPSGCTFDNDRGTFFAAYVLG